MLKFRDSDLSAQFLRRQDDRAHISFSSAKKAFSPFKQRLGECPCLHILHRPFDTDLHKRLELDRKRYQTVFASHTGAIAAPTAGLHFTQSQLEILREKTFDTARLTLHVGPGTFIPIRDENLS